MKDTYKMKRLNRQRHRRTKSYTDYDYKSMQNKDDIEITPDFLMIVNKQTMDASQTQKHIDRDKKKKGDKIVIVDVLEEDGRADPEKTNGFFQFRSPLGYAKPDEANPKINHNTWVGQPSSSQYDHFDRKFKLTEFFQQNPRIDEKDEEVIANDGDEVPMQVATKIKPIKKNRIMAYLYKTEKGQPYMKKTKFKAKKFSQAMKLKKHGHLRHVSV